MHRFFVPQPFDQQIIELAGDEATHMVRVLRLSAGAQVVIFDGQGKSAVAEIRDVGKRSVGLQILNLLSSEAEIQSRIVLATAVPKSDRFRWLVEKATELGVKQLIPIQTERSVVHPGGGKIEKMHAASIAACKQCGRNDLMRIDPLKSWPQVVSDTAGSRLLVADPQGLPLRDVPLQSLGTGDVVLAIGPEGGFTPEEVTVARDSGAQQVSLGQLILRIETAALMMAAWARLSLG